MPVIPAATPGEIEMVSWHVRTQFIDQTAREFGPPVDYLHWAAVFEQMGEFTVEEIQQRTGACRQSIHSALKRALRNHSLERTGRASYRWTKRDRPCNDVTAQGR